MTTNGSKPSALREVIASRNTLPSETYHSDAWDCDLELRGLSLGARSRISQTAYTGGENSQPLLEKFYPLLMRSCVYDPTTGEKVFPDDADEAFINDLDPRETDRICARIMKLSALTEAEGKELKKDSATFMISGSPPASAMPSSSSRKSSARRSGG